jgi:hypothetical protein
MNIAVFYHCRVSGGHTDKDNIGQQVGGVINESWAKQLYTNQIQALVGSGLYENSNYMVIGLNGDEKDECFVRQTMLPGCTLVQHGPQSKSLCPTMRVLQDFLPGHEEWAVCFFHTKGALHPNDSATNLWRERLEKHVIWNWRTCVNDLESGQYDAVGSDWIKQPLNDPKKWGRNDYFGGVFWWATAKFLLTLPEMPKQPSDRHEWYLPELWLGNGKPRVRDYSK